MFVHTSALSNVDSIVFISEDNAPTATRSSATTEIARDADGVRNHPGSSVVVPIDAAYNDFLLPPNSIINLYLQPFLRYHA